MGRAVFLRIIYNIVVPMHTFGKPIIFSIGAFRDCRCSQQDTDSGKCVGLTVVIGSGGGEDLHKIYILY
jgi:hypothetical protein